MIHFLIRNRTMPLPKLAFSLFWAAQPSLAHAGLGECSSEKDAGEEEVSALQIAAVAPRAHVGWAEPAVDKRYTLIKAEDVDTLEWLKPEAQNNPFCMKGMIFMDQACEGVSSLPSEEQKRLKPCSGSIWAESEYTTSFLKYDNETRCFRVDRGTWTVGLAKNARTCEAAGDTFCQSKESIAAGHGPCDIGAYFRGVNDRPNGFHIERTSFGWDRVSVFFGKRWHYPVFRIIDADGQRTEWFDLFLRVATRKTCGRGWPSCRISEWAAEGKIAACTSCSSHPGKEEIQQCLSDLP